MLLSRLINGLNRKKDEWDSIDPTVRVMDEDGNLYDISYFEDQGPKNIMFIITSKRTSP